MKKIMAWLPAVMIVISVSFSAFAAETGLNDENRQTDIGVYAHYIDDTKRNTIPVDENGEGSVTLPDGTEIGISDADKTKGQLVIDPITDKEALDWINSVTDGKVRSLQAFHIYYRDSNGNITNADGISVSIKLKDTPKEPVVCALNPDGKTEMLSSDMKYGTITFTVIDSPYYVLGETPSDPSAPPQTGDNSPMTLWIALSSVSGGLLIFTGIYSTSTKKTKNR